MCEEPNFAGCGKRLGTFILAPDIDKMRKIMYFCGHFLDV